MIGDTDEKMRTRIDGIGGKVAQNRHFALLMVESPIA
jgi:hypothetical protein